MIKLSAKAHQLTLMSDCIVICDILLLFLFSVFDVLFQQIYQLELLRT